MRFVRTNVLTIDKEDHILSWSRPLCDLNGMSTRTDKTFASTMFVLKRPCSFSMILMLLHNVTSLPKMRTDG